MTCTDYTRWLSAYVDEQLKPAQRAQLEEHLHTCPTCQAELASLRQMLQSLRTMEAPAVPDLLPNIHRRLTSQNLAQRFLAPWPASLPLHGLALAATAAVVLIIVGLPRASHHSSLEPTMQVTLDKVVSSSDLEAMPQSSTNGRLLLQKREDERATGTESLKSAMVPTTPPQEEQRQYAGSYQGDEMTRLGALSEGMPRVADDQKERSVDADADFFETPSSNERRETVPSGSAGGGFAARATVDASVTVEEAKQEATPANAEPIAPEKKKVELPQAVPTLLQAQWKTSNLEQASAQVSEWVSAQGGFAIATNEHHLSVKLPPAQVHAFLQQFSSDPSLQAPPASPQALWVTISLELVLSQ